jgi:LacI family transcriptional regulator
MADSISVEQLAAHAGVSRRVLERRFKQWLGRSPADHVSEMRLSRVKELLIETDLSIEAIALKSGFTSPEYMTYVFRNAFATTPLKYRRQTCPRDQLPY